MRAVQRLVGIVVIKRRYVIPWTGPQGLSRHRKPVSRPDLDEPKRAKLGVLKEKKDRKLLESYFITYLISRFLLVQASIPSSCDKTLLPACHVLHSP